VKQSKASWLQLVALIVAVLTGAALPRHAVAATHNISISGFAFNPSSIEITAGDTVVWTANEANHTVTAADNSFDSSNGTTPATTLAVGSTFTRTFTTAGTVAYFCRNHSCPGCTTGMRGSIVVKAATTNTPPTISTINARTINEDTSTGAIAFTIGDAQTAATSLTVFGGSSNTTLVPVSNIVFAGSGANRTVTVTPAANRNGSTTISVGVSDGTAATTTTFTLTVSAVNDAPTISNIADQSTSQGTAKGPIAFTINDSETAATSLTLAASSSNTALLPNANITLGGSGTARSITLTPAGNQTGSATVTVTVGDGSLNAGDTFVLTVTPIVPTVTGFTPTSGPANTLVTITGTNFTGATLVRFNTTSASFTVNSATQITATVPFGATTGKISVTNSQGTGYSANLFTIFPPPTISDFVPPSGPVGTMIIISGTNFNAATAVRIGGIAAAFKVNSVAQITAVIPTGATTNLISVTAPGGTATSHNVFTVTGSGAPLITSFGPAGGPGGTVVTITGANFTGATVVRFGGVSATFTVNSANQITATVPSTVLSGPIAVYNAAGGAVSAASFTAAPRVTGFSPTSGHVGDLVTITGVNFGNSTAVRFNGVTAQYVVNSTTQITARVPAGATTGPIGVTSIGGSGTIASSFTVVP
jgi:plastocyanin